MERLPPLNAIKAFEVAASVKLPARAATSKALIALRGGSRSIQTP